jgi:hypothetical protein
MHQLAKRLTHEPNSSSTESATASSQPEGCATRQGVGIEVNVLQANESCCGSENKARPEESRLTYVVHAPQNWRGSIHWVLRMLESTADTTCLLFQ